jgi:hypothetical protein
MMILNSFILLSSNEKHAARDPPHQQRPIGRPPALSLQYLA